jgi:hypothetical protein
MCTQYTWPYFNTTNEQGEGRNLVSSGFFVSGRLSSGRLSSGRLSNEASAVNIGSDTVQDKLNGECGQQDTQNT